VNPVKGTDSAAGKRPPQSVRHFLTVQVMVFSSHVPLALSQSAFVFGSAANAGAATASRSPVMTAKLIVFMNVSYLLEHPEDARRHYTAWRRDGPNFTKP